LSFSACFFSSGDIGIGTKTPYAKLGVSLNESNADTAHYLQLQNDASGYVDWAFSKTGSNDMSITNRGTGAGNTPVMTFKYVADGGNVGIGTISPSYKLDVNGSVNAYDLLINGTSISSSVSGQVNSTAWNSTGDKVFLSNTSAYVGIGTTSPDYPLDVAGNARVSPILYFDYFQNTISIHWNKWMHRQASLHPTDV